jgi:ArsR family transcriptional regulator
MMEDKQTLWAAIDPSDTEGGEARMHAIADEFKECQRAFIAIGDQTRQQIIMTMMRSDINGIRVGEITEKTHLSRPAVSHHIKILKDAGIIGMRREGTRNYYYVEYDMEELQRIERLFGHIRLMVEHSHDRSTPAHR